MQLRQQVIQHLLELPLSTCRAQIGNGLPLENGIDSRDGLNPELTGNEAIFIDIDFDQLHPLIGIIRGDLFDNASKLLAGAAPFRSEEHTTELQSPMRSTYAGLRLTHKKT